MSYSPHNYSIPSIAITCIICLLVGTGCDEKYKPAAYKAAPRVAAGSSIADESAKRPDVTKWTSPEAIRNLPAGNRPGGYRGDAYRGYGKRGYSGMARGYSGMARGYRGDSQPSPYRGYGAQRSYRGNSRPSDSYRGYRR